MVTNETAWKEAAAGRFDAVAPKFRARGLPSEEDVERLLRLLDCPSGSLILDAGSGAGNWSVALALRGYRVQGVDLSPEMLTQARGQREDQGLSDDVVTFELGETERVSAHDEEFDAILCRCVLDFTPSPGASLVEFWRVLKPGGRAVLVTLGAHAPVKREWWRRFLPDYEGLHYANDILPWELGALVRELGWEIVEQFPTFHASVEGATNEYTEEAARALNDQMLQQAVCSGWWMVVRKPLS